MTGDAGDPLGWVAEELERLDREGLRRPTRVCRVLPGGRVEIDGRKLWNFGSNDYLGLASNASTVTRRPRQASALPSGATASPAVVGRSPEIAELERTIAEFEGTGDAIVFPTGYAANLGTVAALTGPGDAVFLERDCHACLVDGAKLGGGKLRVWRRDRRGLMRLDRDLQKASDARRRWIVTEAVFGMDGDAGSVRWALQAAEKFDALVIADHAHATGLDGARSQAPPPRLLITGTLSKAVGALGGFFAGPGPVCDYLRHAAKSHIFSTALPPAIAAAASCNLRRIMAGEVEQSAFRRRGVLFVRRLLSAGLDVRGNQTGPIVPILIGEPEATVRVSAALADAGFFVPAIRPPTVPRGTSRLRISLSAAHPDEALDGLADALLHTLKDAA